MSLNESLLDRTYRLLDSSDLTYSQIAEGSRVDINWLSKLKQRAIDEPGVKKIQSVHDFLAAQSARRPKRARQDA